MDIEFTLLIPEFILAGLGFFVLTVDMLMPRSWDSRRNGVTAASAALGLALVFVVALVRGWDEVEQRVLYDQLILVDRYALLFKALFTATGFAVVLMSVDYVGRKMRHPGEFYAMIVFAVLGATLMAETGELLTAFISIELLSFSLYVLVGLSRGDGRSAEASTKYILLGAISSGIMLYGISLLYGALGTTVFERMSEGLSQGWDLTLVLGFVLFVAGLGFKLSMVPFHMWAPDVYEGAPTPVTALIAVMSKAAAFALALRFFAVAGVTTLDDWRMAIAILAAATMTVGSVTALVQNNIKRLLAYSSIAQVGFVMVGIVALSIDGGERRAAAPRGLRIHEPRGVRRRNRGREPDGQGGDRGLRGPCYPLAAYGNGHDRRHVLAGGVADLRGLRDQVFPVQRGDGRGPAVARCHRHREQRDLALLLPAHRAYDVHGRGGGRLAVARAAADEGRPVAPVRGDGGRRRVSGPLG